MGGKQFLLCAKCGHKYIDWLRKDDIEEKNKVLKRTFNKQITEYNETKKHKTSGGEGAQEAHSGAAASTHPLQLQQALPFRLLKHLPEQMGSQPTKKPN